MLSLLLELIKKPLKSIIIVIVFDDVMSTTVKVGKKTLQLLNEAKKEMKAKSHNEVIKKLLTERKQIPSSMFGSNRKLTSFSEDDRAEFDEL